MPTLCNSTINNITYVRLREGCSNCCTDTYLLKLAELPLSSSKHLIKAQIRFFPTEHNRAALNLLLSLESSSAPCSPGLRLMWIFCMVSSVSVKFVRRCLINKQCCHPSQWQGPETSVSLLPCSLPVTTEIFLSYIFSKSLPFSTSSVLLFFFPCNSHSLFMF